MAIQVVEIELSKLQPIQIQAGYDRLRGLVRLRGEPIGWIDVRDCVQGEISARQLNTAIREQLAFDIMPSVFGPPPAGSSAHKRELPISVIVCTHDRTAQLERLLHSLSALAYPTYEIVVVDNAPTDDRTLALCAQFPVHYVREERPGLDWARNRGIAEAQNEIVAFVDDDAHPDPQWLVAINRGFENPNVMAITGLVVPDELETRPQIRFELEYGGMGRGLRRKPVRGATLSDRDMLWASAFGVGTNMAFRRQLFQSIGGFDNALDVGTLSRGGGDYELLYRLLIGGHTLLYEPRALVWHTHRRDEAGLHRTMLNNGCSIGAFLAACWQKRNIRRRSLTVFFLREWLGWWILRRLLRPRAFPRHLILLELAGTLAGPFAYAAAQRVAIRNEAFGTGGVSESSPRRIRSNVLAPIGKLANAILVLWGLA